MTDGGPKKNPTTAILKSLRKSGIECDISERRLQEYSYDASNYYVRPSLVTFPRTLHELRKVVRSAHATGMSITLRGGGTSMAGNAVGHGMIIDLSRQLNNIGEIDTRSNSVWADAGVVLSDLRNHVEQTTKGALTFAPDPSSHTRATIGGAIGNDACGNHSVEYGRMSHHIVSLELLTIDGAHLIASEDGLTAASATDQESVERAKELNGYLESLTHNNLAVLRTELDTIPRQVSGFHLSHLLPERGFHIARALAGTEGTCAVITRARVRLVPKPIATALLCVGYDSTVESAQDVMTILKENPSAVEGLDASIVNTMRARRGDTAVKSLPEGTAYVMVEFSNDSLGAATQQCQDLLNSLHKNRRIRDYVIVTDAADRAKIWKVREDGAGLSSTQIDGTQTWPGWEDAAVAPEKLADYLTDLIPLIEQHNYSASMYGHFGAGCVHMRLDFDFRTKQGRENFTSFMRKAAKIVVSHGGSLSGEHGDGRARSSLLELMYSKHILMLFHKFKRIWDPQNLLNPGIIVDPVKFTDDLSLTTLPSPPPNGTLIPTRSLFSDLEVNPPHILTPNAGTPPAFVGNSHACIGVGRCRATAGSFMCPSYRATKDEKDSTRGRARVLQELARGQGTIAGGWSNPEVRESLDLCLSCKACSSDCPTGVNIAEAKSELLHDYYEGKIRPFTHYTIGWLPRWLPLLTRISALANIGVKIKPLRWIMDKLGVSSRRKLPAFRAYREIQRHFAQARFKNQAETLILADSFTKAFRPEVIPAAARVLRDSGTEVGCTADACCGLTWISTGQRTEAAERLKDLVQKLDDGSDRKIVVLEPSCAATIRDDGPSLLRTDASRRVAARIQSFAVSIEEAMRTGWRPTSQPPKQAVVQTHCHEHSVFGSEVQRNVLRTWGVEDIYESSSCCGVAGNFGFETEHFETSMKVAEHSLQSALSKGGTGALVLTDGFSCAMQVSQLDPLRSTQHLAIALDCTDTENSSKNVPDDQ